MKKLCVLLLLTVSLFANAKEAVAGVLWAAVIMETEQLKK